MVTKKSTSTKGKSAKTIWAFDSPMLTRLRMNRARSSAESPRRSLLGFWVARLPDALGPARADEPRAQHHGRKGHIQEEDRQKRRHRQQP